jgi:hypothetical protein
MLDRMSSLGFWDRLMEQILQGAMGVGMAWYGSQLFGSERNAKRMYKYHR